MSAVSVQNLEIISSAGFGITRDAGLQIRVIRTVANVEKLRSAWIQMQHHPNSDFDFYCQVLRGRAGEGWEPYILVAERGGILKAILAGRVEQTGLTMRMGYAELLRPKIRSLTFIYGGVMGNPDAEICNAFAARITGALRDGEADAAFFNHLPRESPMYSAVTAGVGSWRRDRFPGLQQHRVLSFADDRKAFHDRMVVKIKRNKSWKKLLKDYGAEVVIRRFRDVSELDGALRAVEQVAKKTYQRALGVGFADNPEMRAQLKFKALKGSLSIFVLHVAEQPVAFWIGTAYQGVFHSDMMGFDLEFNKCSPGMYLLVRTIDGFATSTEANAIHAVDFGLGDAPYKEHLGNGGWLDASVYVFAPSFRGIMLNQTRTLLAMVDMAARFALQRAKLLQKVKTVWRHNMTKGRSQSEPS